MAGFTLVEVLVALVLAGLVVTALASVTRQWLPNWKRGTERLENVERLSLALSRVTADLGATEFVPATMDEPRPLFDGTPSTLAFVRTALGPNARPSLEIVRFAPVAGAGLNHSAPPYMPRHATDAAPAPAAPVPLLRPPAQLEFSYAGRDGLWRGTRRNREELPRELLAGLFAALGASPEAAGQACPMRHRLALRRRERRPPLGMVHSATDRARLPSCTWTS